MKEAVDDIMVTLNEAASEVGLVGGMVDAIAEAMSKVGMGSHAVPSCCSPRSSLAPENDTTKPSFHKGLSVDQCPVLWPTHPSFLIVNSCPPLSALCPFLSVLPVLSKGMVKISLVSLFVKSKQLVFTACVFLSWGNKPQNALMK